MGKRGGAKDWEWIVREPGHLTKSPQQLEQEKWAEEARKAREEEPRLVGMQRVWAFQQDGGGI